MSGAEWAMSFYRSVDSPEMMMHCAIDMRQWDLLSLAEAAHARGCGKASLQVSLGLPPNSPRQRELIERAFDMGVRGTSARVLELGLDSPRARGSMLAELQLGDVAVIPTYARVLIKEGDQPGALRVMRKAEMNVLGGEECNYWMMCAVSWALIDGFCSQKRLRSQRNSWRNCHSATVRGGMGLVVEVASRKLETARALCLIFRFRPAARGRDPNAEVARHLVRMFETMI
jgi:head-tail adaptor